MCAVFGSKSCLLCGKVLDDQSSPKNFCKKIETRKKTDKRDQCYLTSVDCELVPHNPFQLKSKFL